MVGQRIAARQHRHGGERPLRDCVGPVSHQRYAGPSVSGTPSTSPLPARYRAKWCGGGPAKPAHRLGRRAAGCTSSNTCPLQRIRRIPGATSTSPHRSWAGRPEPVGGTRRPGRRQQTRGWWAVFSMRSPFRPACSQRSRSRWRDRGRTGLAAAPHGGLESPSVVPPFGRRSDRRRLHRLREPENGRPWRAAPRVRERVAAGRSSTARIAHLM